MRVGVISDTHGLLRPRGRGRAEWRRPYPSCRRCGRSRTFSRRSQPSRRLTAIRGNIDRTGVCAETSRDRNRGTWRLDRSICCTASTIIDLDPVAAGFGIVVSGHSHQPSLDRAPQRRALSEPGKRRAATLLAAGLDWHFCGWAARNRSLKFCVCYSVEAVTLPHAGQRLKL
jgi:hypothetical protein